MLSAGGAYVDAFGSSTIEATDDVLIVVERSSVPGGSAPWNITSPRDSDVIDLELLGGGDWEFKVTVVDASIETAVIGRRSYRFR